jgi:hypothetical protein
LARNAQLTEQFIASGGVVEGTGVTVDPPLSGLRRGLGSDYKDRADPGKGFRRPSKEDVIRWSNMDVTFWNARNTRMKQDQDRFDLIPKVKAKKGTFRVYLNDPRVIIEKLAGMTSRRDHRIQVPAKGASNIGPAQRIENGCRWWAARNASEWEEGLHNPLAYDQCISMFLRGWTCSRMVLDDSREGYVREDLFDPTTVYPKYSNNRVTRITHRYATTIGDLIEDFPKARKLFNTVDLDVEIECTGFYINKPPFFHSVIANDVFVKPPTAIGYWPWVIGIAKGTFSHSPLGKDKGRLSAHIGEGYLEALRNMLDSMNQFVTILANLPARALNPPMVLKTVDGEPKAVSPEAGETSVLLTTEDYNILDLKPDMANFIPLLTTFQDRINKGALPAALFGEGTSLESGFMSALLMNAAQDNIWPFIKGLSGYHGRRYAKFLEIFSMWSRGEMDFVAPHAGDDSKLESGIPVWSEEGLTKNDVLSNGTYVKVIYEEISPQDRVALGNLAALLVRENVVSMKFAREKYLDIDDPDKIDDEILRERVFLHANAVDALAFKEILKTKDQDKIQAWIAAQQALTGGQGGREGEKVGLPTSVLPQNLSGAQDGAPGAEQIIADLAGREAPARLA